jgi:SAM-dependent methyltransferase
MEPHEYRKMAEVEDTMWYYRALHRHVVDSLAAVQPAAGRVLDAGCGTGGLLRCLQAAQRGWTLAGLDISPLACEFTRQRTGCEVQQGSIAALPFAAAQFNAITSCDVVCQVANPAEAVREFHRCLQPGGHLVLTMPAYQWMYSYHDREVANLRRYARGEVNALLVAGGFRIRRSTYWNTLTFPLAVVRRKIFPPAKPASDVGLFPAPVEAGFNALMAAERAWLRLGAPLPFGNSVLTVAQKP